jgi:4-hydroxy-tetrahydrodipicolinate synthase
MLVTPFREDGALDEQSLVRLVEHVLASGADGIAVGGLASEAHALSGRERRRVVEVVASRARGRVPVLVTASAESTPLAVDLARHAEQHGATAVMLAPPSVTRAGASGLARHYAAVAEAVRLPLMIQDAPAYIGKELGIEFIARLAREHPTIRYVKTEAVPAGAIVAELRAQLGEAIGLFSGAGGLYVLDTLRAGSAGTIPGCDVPELLVAVFRAYAEGHVARSEALFRRILPLLVYQMQALDICIASQKCILAHRGIIARPDLRSPGLVLARHAVADLITLYEALDLSGREDDLLPVHRE